MDLAAPRLGGDDVAEELDEGGTRVPRHRLADDFAGLRVERGEQRERAVPVVFEAVALGAPGRQRQHGIEAVERLNRRLLVDGEHRRVVAADCRYRPITSAALRSNTALNGQC